MKNRFLFALAILLTVAACQQTPKSETDAQTETQTPPAPVGQDTLIGPKGAAPTKFYVNNDITVYQYPAFNILVETVEIEDGSIGESVKIARPTDTVEISRQGFNFFNGVAGNYLFVDEGTYELGRTMYIYDINTREKLGEFIFDSDEIILEGDQITYYTLLDERAAKALRPQPACPEMQEYKEAGLGIGYMEKFILNIKTGEVTATKEYKCRAIS